MSTPYAKLPLWADYGLIPLINLTVAFLVAGFVVMLVGESPIEAVQLMLKGAFGSGRGIGYTLYYATNFIFTGLAVAVAFHGGLFNIGGEGQASIAGVGVAIVCLTFDSILPWWLTFPLAIAAAAIFGAAWVLIPAWLQAYRGSHIVITTIMFNFLASALMVYVMVDILIEPGQMSSHSREFATSAWLPTMRETLALIGIDMADSPLNLSLFWALLCCFLVWLFIWRARLGYEVRATGLSPKAAIYAGIRPARVTIIAMAISGALAGSVGVNEILGLQHRLLLDFVAGAGFTGIAVALMGRNHPVGIILASLLFGALYQGGAELAFDIPEITRDMIITIQGLIILFSGALAYMNRPWIERLYLRFAQKPASSEAPAHG